MGAMLMKPSGRSSYAGLLPAGRKNINTDYNARLLASDIRAYFEVNAEAIEVLIFKGAFKWSSVDKGLLPALSGVVKNTFLTLQR